MIIDSLVFMDPRPILAEQTMPCCGALPAPSRALPEPRRSLILAIRAHAPPQRRLFDGRGPGVTYRKSGRCFNEKIPESPLASARAAMHSMLLVEERARGSDEHESSKPLAVGRAKP
jgi:hypothetical protein